MEEQNSRVTIITKNLFKEFFHVYMNEQPTVIYSYSYILNELSDDNN